MEKKEYDEKVKEMCGKNGKNLLEILEYHFRKSKDFELDYSFDLRKKETKFLLKFTDKPIKSKSQVVTFDMK